MSADRVQSLAKPEASRREILVMISAGAGPEEARAFVQLLADRICDLCRRDGFASRDTKVAQGTGGPRSISFVVDGAAIGTLRAELGTHALIAPSARRGKHARKRWFAAVTVHGTGLGSRGGLKKVDRHDLEVLACRASGPGGQNVNKVNSAVQVRHLPSGISVKVSEQRSQIANLALACRRIERELGRREENEMNKMISERRKTHYRLERGNPVRQYQVGPQGTLEQLNE